MKIPGPGKVELVYTAEDGTETRELVHNYKSAGVAQGMHNLVPSIESFARSCFNYALDTKQDLWFATKDTISKKYDHTFKDIFQEMFDKEYKEKFAAAGIEYFYTLIDDAVARVNFILDIRPHFIVIHMEYPIPIYSASAFRIYFSTVKPVHLFNTSFMDSLVLHYPVKDR